MLSVTFFFALNLKINDKQIEIVAMLPLKIYLFQLSLSALAPRINSTRIIFVLVVELISSWQQQTGKAGWESCLSGSRKLWARCRTQDIQERLCVFPTRASKSGSSWDLSLSEVGVLGAQSPPIPHLLSSSSLSLSLECAFEGAA